MSDEELQALLWEIVRKVATTHSTFHEHYSGDMACPFCDGVQGWQGDDGVIHESECIITKARKLVEKGILAQ